ncbi:MAG: CBS domain-containing protein [Pirellulales bacterium]
MRFTVRQVMTKRVVTIPISATVDDVFDLLLRHNVSGLPVVDGDDRLVAVVSEADLFRLLDTPASQSTALAELWTAGVISVRPEDTLPDVIDLFRAHQVRRFPVVDDEGKLIGVVSRRDVIRMIRDVRVRVARECQTLHERVTASAMGAAAIMAAAAAE